MPTGYLVLPLNGATLPDGSGSVNAPASAVYEVSGAGQTTNSPKVSQYLLDFGSAEHHAAWTFAIPGDWVSGGTLRLTWKMVTATSGNINLKGAAAIVIDASTDDDAVVYDTVVTSGAVSVPATQGQTKTTTLALTMTSAAASRKITVMVGSESTSWTATGNLRMCAVTFEYTK